MAATKMFLIKWYSSSTNLKIYLIFHSFSLFLSHLNGFSDLEDFWDDLPVSRLDFWKSSGSRLDFQEVVWIFLSVLVFQIWKTSGTTYLLVVWTSWKSSGLPGSRLDFIKVLSELPGSRLDFLKVVWTSWKSSDKVFFHIKWSPTFSLAYIRLLQAHIITNKSDPPRIVSFYDSMNHKKFRIKILGFFSSLWRESERYVVFSSQEWKKKKGKSILGALRASNGCSW
ncbi:hypothetical protein IGI04_026390 [Brassica rapa subsp. trilocularis]|uniref:Uncharacterized protein n=1 Tax=Brassica rapa subsp. trilocularis TaxID=1813537 RepID=A0ABQ7KVW1_BRACM|nr:hypothetical protein IGI04_026390 [Brassica rapa subsp. trilocularis]